ncbi:tetratricopeptide repeat protein [Lysinibacillus sp. OL1_EC]|uniref:tetratricopeptide repeat protein n=1 Tax=unclassified Lysinibacillus TaxID=2636778 RepID=UPI00103F1772|nr:MULTISPECIES: tetratricopeptide repeat protein [unclassified Lysinibacillus]MCM0627217.1 tetratricopeptide repeat protein [Lysinibacillus sp. OL1_EC]TBV85021.1 tetratricopeptide repeat protein [Lysinibacillus sp. OL1]
MLSIFKKEPGGIIRHLALEDFYSTLSESEIEEIKDSLALPYQLSNRPYVRDDFDKGNRTYSGSASQFLESLSEGLSPDLRKRVLIEAIKRATNSVDKHFPRTKLAEMAYKAGDFDECERYCLDVINELDLIAFKGARVVAFSRLAIMYEKQGRIQDALNISEQALKIGQHDNTKGGYEGRIEKLKRKASKMK